MMDMWLMIKMWDFPLTLPVKINEIRLLIRLKIQITAFEIICNNNPTEAEKWWISIKIKKLQKLIGKISNYKFSSTPSEILKSNRSKLISKLISILHFSYHDKINLFILNYSQGNKLTFKGRCKKYFLIKWKSNWQNYPRLHGKYKKRKCLLFLAVQIQTRRKKTA